MQRFKVRTTEVTLHFYECARAHCWLLRPEVVVGHSAKGELVLITARRLVGLWIRTCGDCAESFFCCRPCLLSTQHLGRTEQQAAAATGLAVLNDPGLADFIATGAQPETEAGQCAIKMDHVGLAIGQFEPGDGLGVELHWISSGSIWEALGRSLLTIHECNTQMKMLEILKEGKRSDGSRQLATAYAS